MSFKVIKNCVCQRMWLTFSTHIMYMIHTYHVKVVYDEVFQRV